MKMTTEIHWAYGSGMLPSGLPSGPAYCSNTCPHLEKNDQGKMVCDLFMGEVTPIKVGSEDLHVPTYECARQEMQGR